MHVANLLLPFCVHGDLINRNQCNL
jgi:hypothetical protein